MGTREHPMWLPKKSRFKYYVKRDAKGRFKDWASVKRSQAQDRVWKAQEYKKRQKKRKKGLGHRKDYYGR